VLPVIFTAMALVEIGIARDITIIGFSAFSERQ
jgi:hypothetical protein